MLFQGIKGVGKVLFMVLLFGSLVIVLAGRAELLGCTGVVLLQNIVKKDIPDLSDRACVCAEKER